ncbi:hypothetical protein GJ699_04530 [Duganella sp. FT80W]|uniref:Uncharacterized protein n=1 Tax=Duganella guangzhouensis TaxID=2666084 RepID=A0A6I2KUU0_9BURK|nr:hypothetical protein [Duganella guangzhouensis]MRW89242.1 hypothetical protein [Duganella guangzhouensis]
MGKLQTLKPRLASMMTPKLATIQPGSWRTEKQSSTARGAVSCSNWPAQRLRLARTPCPT